MLEKYTNDKIYILGHDNIDIDSFLSCLLLSKYLTFKKIDNQIIIIDNNFDKITFDFIKDKIGIDLNDYVVNEKDIIDKKVFLVDHYKTKYQFNIVGCIDHHYTSEDIKYSYYLYQKASSCGRIIFQIMNDDNFTFDKEDYLYVLYSILLDTNGLRSTKYTDEDKYYVDLLCQKTHTSHSKLQEFIAKCTVPTDLNQSIEVIVNNGHKEYIINNRNIKSSYIECNSIPKNLIEKYIDFIKAQLNNNLSLWVFIIIDYDSNSTTIYKISKSYTHKEYYKKLLSRGNDIMPKVEEEINNSLI